MTNLNKFHKEFAKANVDVLYLCQIKSALHVIYVIGFIISSFLDNIYWHKLSKTLILQFFLIILPNLSNHWQKRLFAALM